ncbi:MAG: hypothetical protein ACNA7J_01575 [Wenzhouxiangella sp.]
MHPAGLLELLDPEPLTAAQAPIPIEGRFANDNFQLAGGPEQSFQYPGHILIRHPLQQMIDPKRRGRACAAAGGQQVDEFLPVLA